MKEVYKKTLLVGIAVIIIMNTATASSIGSTFKNQEITMNPGEVRLFKASMFNLENTSVEVDFKVLTDILYSSYGKDLEIYVIDKNYNIINNLIMQGQITQTPSSEYEWVLQPDGKTYIRSYPFYIYIKVPNKPTFAKNRYKVIISAKTTPEQVHSSLAQSISQERQFVIYVNIHGLLESNQITPQEYNTITQQNEESNTNPEIPAPKLNGVVVNNNQYTFSNTNEKEDIHKEDNYIYKDYGKKNNKEFNKTSKSESLNNTITGYSIKTVKEHPYAWSTITILIIGTIIMAYLWFK